MGPSTGLAAGLRHSVVSPGQSYPECRDARGGNGERYSTGSVAAHVTVLYTNSPRTEANRSFPPFRDALLATGFGLFADDTGTIEIERRDGQRRRDLRYALFFRPEQRVLPLGDN